MYFLIVLSLVNFGSAFSHGLIWLCAFKIFKMLGKWHLDHSINLKEVFFFFRNGNLKKNSQRVKIFEAEEDTFAIKQGRGRPNKNCEGNPLMFCSVSEL